MLFGVLNSICKFILKVAVSIENLEVKTNQETKCNQKIHLRKKLFLYVIS